MQIREATLDDLRYVEAICEASDRTPWTPDMVAPTGDRVVLIAATQDDIVGIAKTHFHRSVG